MSTLVFDCLTILNWNGTCVKICSIVFYMLILLALTASRLTTEVTLNSNFLENINNSVWEAQWAASGNDISTLSSASMAQTQCPTPTSINYKPFSKTSLSGRSTLLLHSFYILPVDASSSINKSFSQIIAIFILV